MAYRKKSFLRPDLKFDPSAKQACVYWGSDRYRLGSWDGKSVPPADVMKAYLRTCEHLEAMWHAQQARVPAPDQAQELLIDEAIALYLYHLENEEDGDLRPDGTLSSHFERAKTHLRPISALFGDTFAAQFGTKELKACRNAWRKASWWTPNPNLPPDKKQRAPKPWRVGYSNTAQQNVVRFFGWLEAEQLIPPGRTEHLRTLAPLRDEHAYEAPTVDPDVVATTIRYTSPQIAAMVRIQQITAMRPGELVQLRLSEIDRSDRIWVYQPLKHKTRWRGKKRMVPLSLECQKILEPFLDRDEDAYIFSPAESAAWWRQQRSAEAGQARKTKVYPSELRARARKRRNAKRRKHHKEPGEHYTEHSYRQAIQYAIEKARKAGHTLPDWKPYAVRHTRITEIQAKQGWDDAQAVAGHESPQTTARYAHERLQRALRIAAGTQSASLSSAPPKGKLA